MADHEHTCQASADLCRVVEEIDSGMHGTVVCFALVYANAEDKIGVIASAALPQLENVRRLLEGGSKAILRNMTPASDGKH